MKSVQSKRPLSTFNKIFVSYLLFAIICGLAGLSEGLRNGVGVFLVLMGMFGLGCIFKRSSAWKSRKNALIVGMLLFIVGAVIVPPQKSNETARADQVQTVATVADASATKAQVEALAREAEAQKTVKSFHKVVSVVDGDTIKIEVGSKIETVRFIGMDTPETQDPRTVVQCFGKEATERMKTFATGKNVAVENDPTQGDRDKYQRLLRYVYLEDGTNVAIQMIREGYAHEYTYAIPYKYQADFKSAYRLARESNAGLWSPSTCSGDTKKAAPAPQPVAAAAPVPRPTPAPAPRPVAPALSPAPAPAPAPQGNCDPNYTPCIPNVDYDLNCPDIRVRVTVIGVDRHRFDVGGVPNVGCESY